jgi:hypothetical protein
MFKQLLCVKLDLRLLADAEPLGPVRTTCSSTWRTSDTVSGDATRCNEIPSGDATHLDFAFALVRGTAHELEELSAGASTELEQLVVPLERLAVGMLELDTCRPRAVPSVALMG